MNAEINQRLLLEFEDVVGCPYCGLEASPEDTVCPHCGKRLIVERRKASSKPNLAWFISGSWVLLMLIYLAVDGLVISVLLAVTSSRGGEEAGLPMGYVTGVVSMFVVNLNTLAGIPSERLALVLRLLAGGEAIVIVWCLVMALILASWRPQVGLVAGFVLGLNIVLLFIQLLFGLQASFIKLAAALAVGALLLSNLGEFGMEIVRHELSLDRGLMTALDYYNRGKRYREIGMLAKAILHWERAVALEPERTALRLPLSNALYAAGRYREAEEHVWAALQASPGDKDLLQFLEHIRARLSEDALS